MESQPIRIEQVVAPRTWNIRQRILYPDGSLKDVQIDEDFEGTHFAAYLDNEIIGVISVFRDGELFQFRKFAVLEDYQQKVQAVSYCWLFLNSVGVLMLQVSGAIPVFRQRPFMRSLVCSRLGILLSRIIFNMFECS